MTKPDQPFMSFYRTIWAALLIVLMTGCDALPKPVATQLPGATVSSTSIPPRQTRILQPTQTFTPVPSLPTHFICSTDWQSMPVLPVVTESARALYQQGLTQGNNARAFSKIGDGEISTDWFFTAFDLGEGHYDVGKHQSLKATLENFQGSFERHSIAAQRGFNTNLILNSAASDPALCNESESPQDCELRVHNPSIAILSLGTNQVHRPEEFEAGMRKLINVLISRKVLPILSTKGDNLEGDHQLNRTLACLAQEYQIPLWNFWAAIQPLPNHGLQPDLEHLTYSGINDFDDRIAMQSAWTVRNLTALQALDQVWKSVNK